MKARQISTVELTALRLGRAGVAPTLGRYGAANCDPDPPPTSVGI